MPSDEQTTSATSAPEKRRGALIGRESLNIPNFVTVIRLFLAVLLFSLIASGGWWISAAALFVFAASTDALDGYLARRYQQITVLGRILDPFVDKIIVCGTFVFLLERGASDSGVNGWMVITIIGREMFVSSLRGILEKEGKDFSASLSGKLKMSLQCVAITACLLSLSENLRWEWLPVVRDWLLWTAVVVTVLSGMVYLLRGFALLRDSDQ